jgi:hypothetical protein
MYEGKETKINICPKEGTEVIRIITEPLQERKINEWNPKTYNLYSMKSVISLAQTKGSRANTVISYSDVSVKVILDDSIQDRPLDRAVYCFEKSQQLLDWEKIFDKALPQKDLVDFLKRRADSEFIESEFAREKLISQVQKIKFITEIKGEFEYDDNSNISVMYKETNGTEGIMQLPGQINICITLLNESDWLGEMFVELELIKPKAEGEKPVIKLTCPKLKSHMLENIMYEVNKLKTALPEYLILSGNCF